MLLFIYEIKTSKDYNDQIVELVFRYKSNNLPKCSFILKEYIQIYPVAKILYLLFKKMLQKHYLDNP